jgi:hypothetical protein
LIAWSDNNGANEAGWKIGSFLYTWSCFISLIHIALRAKRSEPDERATQTCLVNSNHHFSLQKKETRFFYLFWLKSDSADEGLKGEDFRGFSGNPVKRCQCP